MSQRVVVFGGNGFVGRAICKLLRKDFSVFTFDRSASSKNNLKGNILHKEDVDSAIKENDIIINLIALTPLQRPKGTTYHKIHVDGLKILLNVCKKKKVKKLIHMSALGANKNSDNEYLKTKGMAEELVENSKLHYVIFKPSLIYDKENEFIQTLQKLAWTRSFPKIPAKMQPVFRGDIAQLFYLASKGKIKEKKVEVGGPDKMSLFDLAKRFYRKLGYVCFGIPLFLVKVGMSFAILFRLFGLSKDQLRNLTLDNTTNSTVAAKYIKSTKFDEWLAANY
jgi:nucleoside-diphosphate-sugar epimerase